MKNKIGIIGLGYVGSAVYSAVKDKNMILFNDPLKENSSVIDTLKKECEAIFVCVPTPSFEDGSLDSSIVLDVLKDLIGFEGVIIVKSTILSSYLPDLYNIVYNPEFLNEVSSIEDFKNQKYIVLGGEIYNTSKAESIYKKYFDLDFESIKFEHCSVEEASNLKYFNNIYGAYKVLFWEFVHDITNGRSRKIAKMMKNLPDPKMDIVGLDGSRGYGGACFPKDVNAFDSEHDHALTNFMKKFNKDLS